MPYSANSTTLPPEEIERRLQIIRQCRTKKEAAQVLGMNYDALLQWCRAIRAAVESGRDFGIDVPPGFSVRSYTVKNQDGDSVTVGPSSGDEYETPPSHTIKGESALLDAEGRVKQRWIKTRSEPDPLDIIETIKEALTDYEPPKRKAVKPPKTADPDTLCLIPLADWHIGMYAWGEEAATNWDTRKAEKVIGEGIEALIARTPPSAQAVVLGGGDLLHADTNENRTARSGHALDVDGRHQRVLATACRLVVRTIDAALIRHGSVLVRILPGNHDEYSAAAVTYYLSAYFKDEPRVEVDTDPGLFWFYRFGKVLLGATHGHTVRINRMPRIMADRRSEDWGRTKHRFIHGFHLHKNESTVGIDDGVQTRIWQTPAPMDAWAYGSGYLSGRSLNAVTYHRERGRISETSDAMLDA